jgi:hypothetical protein
MKITIIGEFGYFQALYGLGLSFGLTSGREFDDFNTDWLLKCKLRDVAYTLYHKDGGHNKFLESMEMWTVIAAPRYWCSEADTYRMSSKQSESTIHTLLKTPIIEEMFVDPPPKDYIIYLESLRVEKKFKKLKADLPEGYIQTREWKVSYKTLRNIIIQRRKHKLEEWPEFCDYIMNNAIHKEFFDDLKY